jgi:hypothetical protein
VSGIIGEGDDETRRASSSSRRQGKAGVHKIESVGLKKDQWSALEVPADEENDETNFCTWSTTKKPAMCSAVVEWGGFPRGMVMAGFGIRRDGGVSQAGLVWTGFWAPMTQSLERRRHRRRDESGVDDLTRGA